MPRRIPSYRHHKARDYAVVTINGKDHYLGKYDSNESRENYHRLIAEHLADCSDPPLVVPPETPLSITELIARYWRFVKSYYVKNGRPTSEQATIKHALRFLRRLYGTIPATEFSPKKLKAVREAMIAHDITRKCKQLDPETGKVIWITKLVRHGLARRFINKQVSRIRRLFGWAVEEELLPVEVHMALLRLGGLKKGKTAAREKNRVKPVSLEHVDAILPHVPEAIRAMIQVQRLTGCRPQDVVLMHAAAIDRSGAIWEYRPDQYKTEHHNDDGDPDMHRVVYLGPRAQLTLTPFIEKCGGGYLFSPIQSEKMRNAKRREERKSPMTPSQAARSPKGRSRSPLRDRYDVDSYRRAIRRACEKASIPIWHPNQLRHQRLTEIRKAFGLEASRVCGGHREIGVTQIYAEQDRELALKVMAKMG